MTYQQQLEASQEALYQLLGVIREEARQDMDAPLGSLDTPQRRSRAFEVYHFVDRVMTRARKVWKHV